MLKFGERSPPCLAMYYVSMRTMLPPVLLLAILRATLRVPWDRVLLPILWRVPQMQRRNLSIRALSVRAILAVDWVAFPPPIQSPFFMGF